MDKFDLFLEDIRSQSNCYVDETIKAKDIRCGNFPDIFLTVKEGPPQPYGMTSRAEGQLLARMDIPVGYMHRCPHNLYQTNLEYWLKKSRKELMFRCRQTGNDQLISRAVVSQRFDTSKDDYLVFPVVIETLRQEAGKNELRFISGTKWDDFTQLTVAFPASSTIHQGLACMAGISISNSEIGLSTLCIQPTIRAGYQVAYDLVDRSAEGTTRLRHTGTLNKEELPEAISLAKRTAEIGIAQIIRSSQEVIKEPAKEVENFVRSCPVIPSKVLLILEKEWKDEEQTTKFDLAISIMAVCKKLPAFQQYLAKQEVGRYLHLFQSSEGRLKAIVEESQ